MEKCDKQNTEAEFIYPVGFEDFVDFRKKQNEVVLSGFNIKQLSKIRKLKKMLEMTQQKICNRIKLFKKVSMNIQKKKEKQNILHEKHQNLKKSHFQQHLKNDAKMGYLRSTKSSASLQRIKINSETQKNQANIKKFQVVQQQKFDHAKQIKMWKQRNKIVMQQRKIKEMREKVQSANMIRNNRHRAKQIKNLCQQERLEQARRIKQQKFKEEVQKYDQLQSNLTRLQRQQRQALIMWKSIMNSQQN